jgi:hypothetical protein
MTLAYSFLILAFFMYGIDVIRCGWKCTTASPFWIFSIYFLLSYPIKYLILRSGIPIQAPRPPDMHLIDLALILSMVFWLFVRVIYSAIGMPNGRHANWITAESEGAVILNPKRDYAVVVLVVFLILSSAYYYYSMLSSTEFQLANFYKGNEQNEARFGSGMVFMAGGLYLTGFFIYLFGARNKNKTIFFVFAFSIVSISFIESILLATRRPLFLAIYLLLLYKYLKGRTSTSLALLAIYPIAATFIAPVAQVIRYSVESIFDNGFSTIDFTYALTTIGSTFEGIEYLSRFLERASSNELVFGVDFGAAYLFNAVLALVPRSMWPSKPEIYGSVEIQDFLYGTGFATTTLPSGIVVDSMYGFGVVGFMLYAGGVAYILSWMDKVLFKSNEMSAPLKIALATYLYIYMFNLVRGGTGIIQGLLMLAAWMKIAHILSRLRIESR